jgi:hypothetical protein
LSQGIEIQGQFVMTFALLRRHIDHARDASLLRMDQVDLDRIKNSAIYGLDHGAYSKSVSKLAPWSGNLSEQQC